MIISIHSYGCFIRFLAYLHMNMVSFNGVSKNVKVQVSTKSQEFRCWWVHMLMTLQIISSSITPSISVCLTPCSCSIQVKEFSPAGLIKFYIVCTLHDNWNIYISLFTCQYLNLHHYWMPQDVTYNTNNMVLSTL